MAEGVSRLMKVFTNRCTLPYQFPVTRSALFHVYRLRPWDPQRSFSQSTSTLLPRIRSNRDGYPGFRNESKEHRHVREHNLFDPQLHYPESADDVSDSNRMDYPQSPTRPPDTLPLHRTQSSELERELLFLSSRNPTDPRVRNLLHHIVYDRKQSPNATLYEALIFVNASPDHGSAKNMRNLIQEMEQQGITTNVNVYDAILRTLVVHPDVDVLNDVIEACENQWIEIDADMRHLICAAYLRAGMTEIALDHLGHLEHGSGDPPFGITNTGLQRGRAELWLYVLFIQRLAEQNDWEGALRLCYRLYDDTSSGIPLASRHLDIPYVFWASLLEQSSVAKDKWVTFWIWENWVLKAWIQPSPDTCLRILEICADNGTVRIAETVVMILRFISKDIAKPSLNIEAESQSSSNLQLDTAKALLMKTYENAQPNEPRPSHTEIRRITAEWWMFDTDDKIGLDPTIGKGRRSLRINPWSTLRENTDPGRAWARRVNEQEAVLKRREDREALRRMNLQRAEVEAGYVSMRRTLPSQLLTDIEKAVSAELDDNETDDVSESQSRLPDHKPSSTTKDTDNNRSPGPRIRLIDPEKRASNKDVENTKIKEWMKLGLDLDTALKIDDRKGNRVWRLRDSNEEGDVPKTVDNPSNSQASQIRLYKVPETTPDAEWYSKWSEMLVARKKFEKSMQRKRRADARTVAEKAVGDKEGKASVKNANPRHPAKLVQSEAKRETERGNGS